MKRKPTILLMLVLQAFLTSCDDNQIDPIPIAKAPIPNALDSSLISGTGEFNFTAYTPLASKPIQVFYHIPINATSLTPILFVFHGAERDGNFSRNALITKANNANFIVIAPQFSLTHYPDANDYNLGNLFKDGENPTISNRNSESDWTFSVIEPIFDLVKMRIGSAVNTYDLFGHSAGGQFVHRYLIFKPAARVNKAVVAASGWYTLLDSTISFPYGTEKTTAQLKTHSSLLSKSVYIIVGNLDTDENSFGLRHNTEADKQGLNRFTRAQYFYNQTQTYAANRSLSFQWQYQSIPKVGHDFIGTSSAGMELLYP